MKRNIIKLSYQNVTEQLAPLLRGRVVHITCAHNIDPIIKEKGILSNQDGKLASSFGSSDSAFFRLRGEVSVFDYRTVNDKDFEDAWRKCGPHRALQKCSYHIALLFLNEKIHGQLTSWKLWKETEKFEQMVVPYVEAGFPGKIPLESIQEIIEISVKYQPSGLELIIQESRD